MQANSVRKFQPFATSMIRFRHEVKKQLDNAYILCTESDPALSCIEDCCPFYKLESDNHCQLHILLDLIGDS